MWFLKPYLVMWGLCVGVIVLAAAKTTAPVPIHWFTLAMIGMTTILCEGHGLVGGARSIRGTSFTRYSLGMDILSGETIRFEGVDIRWGLKSREIGWVVLPYDKLIVIVDPSQSRGLSYWVDGWDRIYSGRCVRARKAVLSFPSNQAANEFEDSVADLKKNGCLE